jgi:excisionase family DNA binding protein
VWSRKKTAERLGVSLSTVERLMRAGKLPYTKVGRRSVFKPEDVEAFIAANRVKLEAQEGAA